MVVDVAGFYFLDLATDYEPDEDLKKFLEAGPPPVYIGCILAFAHDSATSILMICLIQIWVGCSR